VIGPGNGATDPAGRLPATPAASALLPGRGVGWRLRIRHRTGFSYAGEVGSSYNEARMTPRTEPRQTTLAGQVEVRPTALVYRYWDYWGTQVTAFDLHAPHSSLTVTATAVVETMPPAELPEPVDWAALGRTESTDDWCEYLRPTERTQLDEELFDIAAGLRADAADPRVAALAACEWVRAEVEYVPGATEVHTSARDAWQARKGVCQDLSHLAVGLIRAMGVPARYVSGYLHPTPDAVPGEQVVGQSHAWVEFWDGGWTPYDPTNGIPAGERHVVVGRGRDYADVPPLKGVYAGPPSTLQGVEVEITRLR
jgi:transglutaminase-like putative cysteine protease